MRDFSLLLLLLGCNRNLQPLGNWWNSLVGPGPRRGEEGEAELRRDRSRDSHFERKLQVSAGHKVTHFYKLLGEVREAF